MKNLLATIVMLLVLASSASGETRKKVGLVLSGGGAKGASHISVLKVLEEHGVPVDIVVGTSMGSIIGGLYSIGYTPAQMDSVIATADWDILLTDKNERKSLSFIERQHNDTYVFSFPIRKNLKEITGGGFVKGDNIYDKFIELTQGYHHVTDFSKLPRSFASVAYNIVDGSEVVFTQGELALAMRASMSIPGVFAPVHLDSMVLIDGGMVNNYPADVAKRLGADIIIGVDIQDEFIAQEDLKSIGNVASQIVNLIVANKFEENKAITDLYFYVPLKGYSAASYNKTDIDSIMARGEQAARAKTAEISALADRIRASATEEAEETLVSIPPYHKPDTVAAYEPLYNSKESTTNDALNGKAYLGVRFDTEELTAITIKADVMLDNKQRSELSISTRLGKRTFGKLDLSLNPAKQTKINLGYTISYDDLDFRYKSARMYSTAYLQNKLTLDFSGTWKKRYLVSMGAYYENIDYKSALYSFDEDIVDMDNRESLIVYYAQLQMRSLDKRAYPTKGAKWGIGYELITDNSVTYNDGHAISVFTGYWERAFSANNRLTFIPSLSARALIYDDKIPFSKQNFFGGDENGRYRPQQLLFYGIGGIEFASPTFVVGSLRTQYRIMQNYYALLGMSYAYDTDIMTGIANGEHILGGNIGAGFDSVIGPLEMTFGYANHTDKLNFMINLGFYF